LIAADADIAIGGAGLACAPKHGIGEIALRLRL
jgi:hypothetical protein